MSNRAYIETLSITKTYDKDRSYFAINVFDDYNDVYIEVDEIPDNDIDIFRLLIEEQEENHNESVYWILYNMKEYKRGITINRNYLESHETNRIIKEYED